MFALNALLQVFIILDYGLIQFYWCLGPCTTSSMQRWYYEPASRTCRQFTFGGCGGNGNNFVTLRDCEAACDGVTGGDVRRLCDQRPEAGPCRGQLTRFFYDPDSGACQQFLYGGCAGNRNNFISIEDCSSTCDDKLGTKRKNKQRTKVQTCSLLSDHGPCSNDQTRCEITLVERIKRLTFLCRWFYNKYKDRCEPFSWGGCLGNMNNFNSNSTCENMCRPRTDTTTIVQPELASKETSTVDHICSLPSSAGSCDDDETHERFFYDILTEECRKFVYSGCGGNLNNFHSLNECSDFCGQ